GYLGSFLSNSLKTHQLEVNTDSKTLRPIARLKEPRELFALPKERDYDCPQQAPRWPIECQVLEERVYHLDDAPETPEPYYQPTGKELQPRPVGEENGIIVYNYNPTSAVHYVSTSRSWLALTRLGHLPDQFHHLVVVVVVGVVWLPHLAIDHRASLFPAGDCKKTSPMYKDKRTCKSKLQARSRVTSSPGTRTAGNGMKSCIRVLFHHPMQSGCSRTARLGHSSHLSACTTSSKATPNTPMHTIVQTGPLPPTSLLTPLPARPICPLISYSFESLSEQFEASADWKLINWISVARFFCFFHAHVFFFFVLWSVLLSCTFILSSHSLFFPFLSRFRVRSFAVCGATQLPVDDEVTQPEPEPVPCPGKGGGSVLRQLRQLRRRLQRTLLQWEASEYVDRDYSYEEMNDAGEILPYDEENQIVHQVVEESPTPDRDLVAMHLRKQASAGGASSEGNVQKQVDSSTVCDREAVSSSPDSDRDGCQPLSHVDSTSSTNNNNNNNNNNNSDESDDSDGEQTGSSPAVPASMTKTTTNRTPDLCPQFSRSTVGGSKAQPAAHPTPLDPDDLVFESRFESGNLGRAIKITPTYYELYLRPDMYTNRHTQWFYFQVKNTKAKVVYRFSIINLTKPDSLYKEGMRPLMYSTMDAECNQVGWRRCGDNIAYFRNEDNSHYHHRPADDDEDEYIGTSSFTLSFNIEFKYDGDTVYFAHSYPYTYSDLQDYLMCIQRNPVKSKFCKLRLLCRSLAGNNVYYLTVTAPTTHEDDNQKKKKAVIITARVHPGESPSSWMMKGLMDFITGDSYVAKKLRHKFIFKLVPMLNPDGVIVGNTRSSLTGRDLNRQYRTVIRETYPSIWNTKAMIRRLMEDCGVAMYCDMHAHSRKHNVFIYGCENLKRHPDRRLLEQVFPLMLHKNVADKFSFENCKFKVQKNKEGTGRIVVWVLGVTNSYTLEASFGGSTMGGRAGTHFSTADYEHIGRAYCETLMDYYDDNPIKVNYYLRRIKKIRKREKRLRKAQRTEQQESFWWLNES
ncbi:AGAP000113-PA, partial [Anopheles gambiae str. PEST]